MLFTGRRVKAHCHFLDIVEMLAGQAGISLQNALMFRRLKIYADEIESSRDEISEWNRKLEQRVELRTEELNKKNLELSNALGKLQEQADMVEELAVSRERNRFAMDSHDNLGHTMTLLIKLLEVCWMTSLNDPEKMESYLKDASRIAREGLEQLRASVKGLVTEKMRENNLITSLKGLIGNFEALGIHVELSVQGLSRLKEPECVNTLYNLCIEAMTNALRHGKAKNISIIIKNEVGFIRMAIFDDGCGCDCIDKGFGLSGMEKRVKALNGDISFSSGADDGFLIRVEIPLVKESDIW